MSRGSCINSRLMQHRPQISAEMVHEKHWQKVTDLKSTYSRAFPSPFCADGWVTHNWMRSMYTTAINSSREAMPWDCWCLFFHIHFSRRLIFITDISKASVQPHLWASSTKNVCLTTVAQSSHALIPNKESIMFSKIWILPGKLTLHSILTNYIPLHFFCNSFRPAQRLISHHVFLCKSYDFYLNYLLSPTVTGEMFTSESKPMYRFIGTQRHIPHAPTSGYTLLFKIHNSTHGELISHTTGFPVKWKI